ncbi:MAG: SDR family NAD(P)-dependent oxidoreductase [Kineosporiaceae bacterium]
MTAPADATTDPRPVALVTGASSGIGEASVRALAAAGFEVVAAARRTDRLERLAAATGCRALTMDVTDPASVAGGVAGLDRVDAVVHAAGGALGLEPALSADLDRWRQMYETNVLAVARVTQAVAGLLRASGRGHVIVIGSVAGQEVYPGGGGYTAAKHGTHALARTLRWELSGEGVRVTEIAPGMVRTEFSLVRFGGDAERADRVYEGLTPLGAEDVAAAVVFAATRPPHVDVEFLQIKPTAQVTTTVAHRRPPGVADPGT